MTDLDKLDFINRNLFHQLNLVAFSLSINPGKVINSIPHYTALCRTRVPSGNMDKLKGTQIKAAKGIP